MNNTERPAFPNDKDYQVIGSEHEGYTKREDIAKTVLAGLVAAGWDSSDCPKQAVKLADKLLEELEKTDDPSKPLLRTEMCDAEIAKLQDQIWACKNYAVERMDVDNFDRQMILERLGFDKYGMIPGQDDLPF